MRKMLFAGNWKMNLTAPEACELASGLRKSIERAADLLADREVMVAPPAIDIPGVAHELFGAPIALGAQNMYFDDSGAFTGEISPPMLKAFGVTFVILGHSERRHIFGEPDGLINRKVRAAIRHGITPVLCIGETEAEHDSGQALAVVLRQLEQGLEGLSASEVSRTVIAYEPVWAIGTGRNATPEQAQLVHASVRTELRERCGFNMAGEVRILYGGSVNPGNVDSLVAQPDIDGALVGGASLKLEPFMRIVRALKS